MVILFGAHSLFTMHSAHAQFPSAADRTAYCQETSEARTPQYRYEALSRPVRYKSARTTTDTIYEERVITYTEPQTVYRTVREDRGSWEWRRRPSLLGTRTERVWVPRIVETQVPEVIQVERQRVERIPHEVKQEIGTTIAESVVVHARRPVPRRSASATETYPLAAHSPASPPP
jgi:hypothetical protein